MELGVDISIIQAAKQIAAEYAATEKSLEIVKNVAQDQDRTVSLLKQQYEILYEKAKQSVTTGDEIGARSFLADRQIVKESLDKAIMEQLESTKRVNKVEELLRLIKMRAEELEDLMRRSRLANVDLSLQRSTETLGVDFPTSSSFPSSIEDPLEARFRALEKDNEN